MQIKGKVAIITGASSGFGKALAKVVLGDITAKTGNELAGEINAKHPDSAVFQTCDVSSKSDQQRLFDLALSRFSSIDIVINNAGIGESRQFASDVEDSWVKVLRIDLEAVIIGTRLAVTHMIQQGKPGVIVNTASLAGLYPQPFQPVYAAAKGGVVHFSRSFKSYKKSHDINVNAICPSFSPTALLVQAEKNFGKGAIPEEGRVPVELVIDAFVMAIEDDSLAGAAIRITPQHGIDQYSWSTSAKAKI
ncbi:hypothetical protein HKX48_002764 [Thoreauomyces humboldtii]|nr:hypothetical protein HKX48_002764 [Thoreauomyces humboldtii]